MPKYLNHVKEDILTETRKMLSENESGKLSIRAIASRCGIASGTVYNYFKSKEEVIDEILQIDWNRMLRRIDNATKAQTDIVDKFGIIYNELCLFMKDAYKIWPESSFSNNEKGTVQSAKQHKIAMFKELSQKVLILVENHMVDKDVVFLADVISRILLIYSHRDDVTYDKLKPILVSLLSF